MKALSEMSLEELWRLFPIYLTDHKTCWKEWYIDEENLLKNSLPSNVKINHIGSTAIDNICAKPIIDILVEVPLGDDILSYAKGVESCGYICMSNSSTRLSFNKGYTVDGFAEKVFHIHLRYVGDNDELYFRDYLNDNPNIAHEYENLKLKLWKEFENNRDAYTNAKTEFVKKYTAKAKDLYGDRYI